MLRSSVCSHPFKSSVVSHGFHLEKLEGRVPPFVAHFLVGSIVPSGKTDLEPAAPCGSGWASPKLLKAMQFVGELIIRRIAAKNRSTKEKAMKN